MTGILLQAQPRASAFSPPTDYQGQGLSLPWGTFSRYKVKRYLHKSEKEMSQKVVHLTPKFAFSSPPVRIPKTVQFLCTDSGLNTLAWTYLLIVMEMTGKQYQYFQLYNFVSLIDLLEPEPLNFASSF